MFFFLLSVFLLSVSHTQQSMRENKEKQALGDLMIKPVQRIPRYELLVKVSQSLIFIPYLMAHYFHMLRTLYPVHTVKHAAR